MSGFEHYRSFPEMGIDRSNVQELDSQLIFTCSESTRETLEKVWNIFKGNNKSTFFRVSVVDFEQVNVSWVNILMNTVKILCIKKYFRNSFCEWPTNRIKF